MKSALTTGLLLFGMAAGCGGDKVESRQLPPLEPFPTSCAVPDPNRPFTYEETFSCPFDFDCAYRFSAVYEDGSSADLAFPSGDLNVPSGGSRFNQWVWFLNPVTSHRTVHFGYSERWCAFNGLPCDRFGLFELHLVPDHSQCPSGALVLR